MFCLKILRESSEIGIRRISKNVFFSCVMLMQFDYCIIKHEEKVFKQSFIKYDILSNKLLDINILVRLSQMLERIIIFNTWIRLKLSFISTQTQFGLS